MLLLIHVALFFYSRIDFRMKSTPVLSEAIILLLFFLAAMSIGSCLAVCADMGSTTVAEVSSHDVIVLRDQLDQPSPTDRFTAKVPPILQTNRKHKSPAMRPYNFHKDQNSTIKVLVANPSALLAIEKVQENPRKVDRLWNTRRGLHSTLENIEAAGVATSVASCVTWRPFPCSCAYSLSLCSVQIGGCR